MKEKKRNILVYTDGMHKMHRQLTIQVDDAGDEWLTPEQVDYLETIHMWARYEGSNPLKASRTLVTHYTHPMLEADSVKSFDSNPIPA